MAKKLKIGFLGGVGEIGKNMTVIEYGDSIIVIDAGLTFPSEEMLGVDVVIPDFSYLVENKEKVKAILCTHGHEDHIGAIPYLLQVLDSPVIFGSTLTLGLIRGKIEEFGLKAKMKTVDSGTEISVDCFKIRFYKVCHSIAGALALSIDTPQGMIFHTGDFKIDHTPIDNEQMDFYALAELGKKGVKLMLSDSTNAERPGHTISEKKVGESISRIFAANSGRRIIVATFASNLHRIQQILDIAAASGRRVILSGRSVIKVVELGKTLKLLHYDDSLIVNEAAMKKIPPEKLCIICTGSQGERVSALTRMAAGEHPSITVGIKDTIIISASAIPGNEKSIYNVINSLYRLGAEVIYAAIEDVHTSGHAHQEELKMMLSLIRPKFFIPVHGEFRHLKIHAGIAQSMGIPKENILIPELGWCVEVAKDGLKKLDGIKAGNSYVDGDAVGDLEPVIKDRRQLSADGFIIILLTVSVENGKIPAQPEIITRGMAALSEEEIAEMKKQVVGALKNMKYINSDNREAVKSTIRRTVRKMLYQSSQSSPMIVPIVVEK
ncbi:MAG: ribonuclease J [Clostridia bacterium]|nr:ribonuclease J [Clostridia bacterium]